MDYVVFTLQVKVREIRRAIKRITRQRKSHTSWFNLIWKQISIKLKNKTDIKGKKGICKNKILRFKILVDLKASSEKKKNNVKFPVLNIYIYIYIYPCIAHIYLLTGYKYSAHTLTDITVICFPISFGISLLTDIDQI